MKKKYLLAGLLTSLLLVSCGENSSSIEPSNPSNDNTSVVTPSTSEDKDSTPSSSESEPSLSSPETSDDQTSSEDSTPSVPEVIHDATIKEIKEKAQEYKNLKDKNGFYQSDYKVKLNLQLIATVDAVTSKGNSQYKALMSDGNDYIYVNIPFKAYESMKKYTEKYDTYEVIGYISWSYDEVEIKCDLKPQWLEGKAFKVDYKNIAEDVTLVKAYEDINNMNLNYKGCAYGKLV